MKAIVSMSYTGNAMRMPLSLQHELIRQGYNTSIFVYYGDAVADSSTQKQFNSDSASAAVFFGIITYDTLASERVLVDFMNVYQKSNCKAAVLLVDRGIRIRNIDGIDKYVIYFNSSTGEIYDLGKLKRIIDSVRSDSVGAKVLLGAAALTLLGLVVSDALLSKSSRDASNDRQPFSERTKRRATAKKASAKATAKKASAKATAKKTSAKATAKKASAKATAKKTSAKATSKKTSAKAVRKK